MSDRAVVDLTRLDPADLDRGDLDPEAGDPSELASDDGAREGAGAGGGARLPRMEGQRLRPGWVPEALRAPATGPSKILVLHVPKTGGSSLRQMLAAHVPVQETFLSTGRHEWRNLSISELSRFRLFTGHQFLEPLYLFPDEPWVTILPVREPLAWWRSFYKYRRRRAQAKGVDHPVARLPMDEWLAGLDNQALSNPQSSWLLARTRVMFDSPFQVAPRIADTGACLESDPDRAVHVLDRMLGQITVVGVTDQLQELYLNICHELGERPQFATAIEDNVTRQPEELLVLSDRQERRLRALNQMDGYLYQRARQRSAQLSAARSRGRRRLLRGLA